MSDRLIILGTSGNAYDLLDLVEALNGVAPRWSVAGFLDDGRQPGSVFLGLPVLGRLTDAARYADHQFVNAIGSDTSYPRRPEFVAATGLGAERFATLIHPGASVSSRARLGQGVCVHFGASVAGGVVVGDHAALGPGCVVGHHAIIDEHALVAPAAVISGSVHLRRACYIGARAVIRQGLSVGDEALVGMGAVVVADVASGIIVVGNPARPLRRSRPAGEQLRPVGQGLEGRR
jgi:sugar O-acyltransferase (sialic acid O-acetyltransferase NeuD family)